ncbi:hypothetical protein N8613_00640 [Verrucomicrobia bacterium]|nr:hypothetical protein [Verrucomicrobiota bacterium]
MIRLSETLVTLPSVSFQILQGERLTPYQGLSSLHAPSNPEGNTLLNFQRRSAI